MPQNCRKTAGCAELCDSDEDILLVKRFSSGDSSAFDRLVELYATDVSKLANRLLGWDSDIEDIVQDVFLAAFVGLKKFRCHCSVKTWLFSITVNKCRRHRYRRMLKGKLLLELRQAQDSSCNRGRERPDEKTEQLRKTVRSLPVKLREPIILRYLQGLSIDEITKVLKISKNAVNTRLSRARKTLENILTEQKDNT